MKRLLYMASLLALFNCTNTEKSTQSTGADTVLVTDPDTRAHTAEELTDTTLSKSKPTAQRTTWIYEETTDSQGGKVYKASITSPDILEFGFPYAGGSTATLTIRKRSSGTNVYLQVSKGQFNRSFQGGQAYVRFDGASSTLYSYSAAENGRANIIFFDADQALIPKIKAAKKVVVDVGFYGQGQRKIEFRTAGLNWNY